MNCIEVKNICKSYGAVHALRDVSLRFEENKIYGLLGRNGAGKTTLLNTITGRIFSDGGEVLIDGAALSDNETPSRKLYMTAEQTLHSSTLQIREAFYWTAQFFPAFDMGYALRLAREFGLDLKKRIRSLSTGYTSIFKLILALSVNTPYLLLDEPILGLDANHRDLFYRRLLEKFSENPCTIILSTHLIEEVSPLIDEIVILKDGAVIRSESRDALLSDGYTVSGTAQQVDAYLAGKQAIGCDSLGGLKTAYLLGKPDPAMPDGLEVTGMDLQKLFVQLTNS